MDSRQLQLVLKLQDEASRELRKVSGELDTVNATTGKWDNTLKNVKRGIMAIGAAAVTGLGFGVKIAADLQTAEVGLTTLLGSTEEARETIERLKVEAARTPFELPGLTQATQLLTSVTKDGDESIDILLDVGEALAAMGKGQSELDRIIVNLQQIAATGKAAAIDIKQFAFAGIPIYEMLEETTGKTGDAVAEMVTNGEISFDLLTTMFDEANDAGGRFFNAFANQGGTFNQALSNMKDSIGIFLADIATSTGLLEGLAAGMMKVGDVVGNYEEVWANAKNTMSEFFQELDDRTLIITHIRESFAAMVELYNTMLRPALEDLMIALEPLKPFGEALATVFGVMIVGGIHILITTINLLIAGTTMLLTGFTNLATFIANTLNWIIENLSANMRIVAAVMTGDWGGAIDAVQDKIKALVEWVTKLIDGFKRAIDLAKEIGGGAIDFLGGLLPGRAVGGSVAANKPYKVGENGVEMFVPRGNGTIVPNHDLVGMGGGGGTNIYVYGDVTGEELVTKVKRSLERDIKQRYRTS